jgi:glycosidase
MIKLNKLFIFIIMLISMNSQAFAGSTDSWKDQILYFVLLDRFYDGNKENCPNVDKDNLMAFHGGDIAGLEQKLGYLKELGITGIWVSPFLKNRPNAFYGQEAYHGYWPYDFFNVDERFGTKEDLISLRKAMKNKNMKLLLDMVVNHVGYDAPFVNEHKDWFNPMINIKNWDDPEEVKNRCIFGLPDFASQKPEVKQFFCDVSKYWIELLQPDGFRLDAVKHVNDDFWHEFNDNARKLSKSDFILLGEYLHGDPVLVNKIWHSAGFDCLFDFPLYYTMKDVFAQNGDCRKLASRLYYDRYYPDAGMLATLLDNHDLDRFISSCRGDMNKYKLAMAFLMSVRGIPTLCYGDEQALRGTHKSLPHNRCDMKFTIRSKMFNFTKEMIAMRKSNEALRRGLHCHIYADNDLYIFGRLLPNQLCVAMFNNSDEVRNFEVDFPFVFQNNNSKFTADYGDKDCYFVKNKDKIKGKISAKNFAIFTFNNNSNFYEKAYESWNNQLKFEDYWGRKKITFILNTDKIEKNTDYYLIGNCKELGDWNVADAVLMKAVSKNKLEAEVELPIGKIFDCKCLKTSNNKTTWMGGENIIDVVNNRNNQSVKIKW